METQVVNLRRQEYDVYIGRPGKGQPGPWGNPFSFSPGTPAQFRVPDRETAIAKFRDWVTQSPDPSARWIREHLHELEGKRLGCFCAPLPCHGTVYLELLSRAAQGGEVTDNNPEQKGPIMQQSVSLHCCEGNSDKVYNAALQQDGSGWTVSFAYGRRGSTLTSGNKCKEVDYTKAHRVFEDLVNSKVAKGYRQINGEPLGYSSVSDKVSSGLHPMLLNPVDDPEEMLRSDKWGLQEKMDGRRIMARRAKGKLEFINRKGIIVGGPSEVEHTLSASDADFLLDGEMIGEQYFAFDILGWKDRDLCGQPFSRRQSALCLVQSLWVGGSVIVVPLVTGELAKRQALRELKEQGAEGVVFRELASRYSPGRPSSGGPALKYKFTSTASVIVTRANPDKRSVAVHAYGPGGTVALGNVTIPPNAQVPLSGSILEVRYLYAYVGGSLFQPVFIGVRDDLQSEECTTSQLRYKEQADPEEEN